MNKKSRPINVGIGDLLGFAWPVTAVASIAHRIAGVVLFVGIGFALFALEMSLTDEQGFNGLKGLIVSPLGKFITWGLLAALAYHLVAGIKHLIMDAGVGETLKGGVIAARVTIFLAAALIVLAAVWVFRG